VNDPPLLWHGEAAGILEVSGGDRAAFLQGLATADFRTLGSGSALWSAALTPTGKVLFTFRAADRGDRVRLLLSPGRVERAAAHFGKYALFRDVRVEAPPSKFVRLDFYGEDAPPPPDEVDAWPPFFELRATWIVDADRAGAIRERLAAAGAEMSEEEAQARRIEAGRPDDLRDIDESRTADEAGLAAAVSIAKGCYVGQEIVARMRTYGRLPRRLVRFRFSSGPPAPGERLVRADDPAREAGLVTSSARSPSGPLGLGYVGRDVEDGATLAAAGGREIEARIERIVEPDGERTVEPDGERKKDA